MTTEAVYAFLKYLTPITKAGNEYHGHASVSVCTNYGSQWDGEGVCEYMGHGIHRYTPSDREAALSACYVFHAQGAASLPGFPGMKAEAGPRQAFEEGTVLPKTELAGLLATHAPPPSSSLFLQCLMAGPEPIPVTGAIAAGLNHAFPNPTRV